MLAKARSKSSGTSPRREELLESFAQVLAQPAAFVKDEIYAALATRH